MAMSGAEAAWGVVPPTDENVRLAAETVRAGGLAVVPTETVYGVAACADS